MTYSDKYALMKAYKLITGDDPDQNPSPESANVGGNTIDKVKIEAIKKAFENKGLSEELIQKGLKHYGYDKVEDIKEKDYMTIYNNVTKEN